VLVLPELVPGVHYSYDSKDFAQSAVSRAFYIQNSGANRMKSTAGSCPKCAKFLLKVDLRTRHRFGMSLATMISIGAAELLQIVPVRLGRGLNLVQYSIG
jgi:hypothetical protein